MARHTLLVERNVEIKMRDGVILRADVYRPNSSEPTPVLLQRTPYDKSGSSTSMAVVAAGQGYAVVIQDTRGRWASDGEGIAYVHEKSDGYDSVDWAAHQPWSNGQVGMFGGSYVGYTQFAAATMQHPALKTICPSSSFCDPYAAKYANGALLLGIAVSWGLLAWGHMAVMRSPADEPEKAKLKDKLIDAIDGMSLGKTFRQLPMTEMPLIGRDGPSSFLADAIAHPTHDSFWDRLACAHETISIPIFHMSGWYDIFVGSTLRDYLCIKAKGNSRQKLLIGPWYHTAMDSRVGEVDFGIRASPHLLVPQEIELHWFDYWLKGIENGVMEEPPVQIFVMGDNRWRLENEWPLARAQYTRFYLHSGGAANSLHGDGTLTREAPSAEALDAFVYDPLNPVPTQGGALCCWDAALPGGAYDQRDVEARPDVLVYTTAPLERDMEVTGPLEVHLWATTTAPDTDFTAKLVDVGPCGYARNVQDGLVRARYRQSAVRAEPIRPGELYEYTIDLAATSNVFKAGHHIRLEISSSNFPRFDRNPNTGHPIGYDAELRPAVQTVFHDASHPSCIVLPVIPRG